jgi:hypothetical protein
MACPAKSDMQGHLGAQKAGSASVNAHGSVGARTKREGRESWKQKRKCVDELMVGERCFIDVDGQGPG